MRFLMLGVERVLYHNNERRVAAVRDAIKLQ